MSLCVAECLLTMGAILWLEHKCFYYLGLLQIVISLLGYMVIK